MKPIYVRNIIREGRDDMLFLGLLKIQKTKHGFKLAFFNEGGKKWDVSDNIRYIYPLNPGSLTNPTLIAYDNRGVQYYFDCCSMTAEEAIDKFNKVIGLVW